MACFNTRNLAHQPVLQWNRLYCCFLLQGPSTLLLLKMLRIFCLGQNPLK